MRRDPRVRPGTGGGIAWSRVRSAASAGGPPANAQRRRTMCHSSASRERNHALGRPPQPAPEGRGVRPPGPSRRSGAEQRQVAHHAGAVEQQYDPRLDHQRRPEEALLLPPSGCRSSRRVPSGRRACGPGTKPTPSVTFVLRSKPPEIRRPRRGAHLTPQRRIRGHTPCAALRGSAAASRQTCFTFFWMGRGG